MQNIGMNPLSSMEKCDPIGFKIVISHLTFPIIPFMEASQSANAKYNTLSLRDYTLPVTSVHFPSSGSVIIFYLWA